jgi:hypothetical protein
LTLVALLYMQDPPLTILEPTDGERQAPWFPALETHVGQRLTTHVVMAMQQSLELGQLEPDERWEDDTRKVSFRFSRTHGPHTSPTRASALAATPTSLEGRTFSPRSPAVHHTSWTSPQDPLDEVMEQPTQASPTQASPTQASPTQASPPPGSPLPQHTPHQVCNFDLIFIFVLF